jgi:hypothetical protein
VGSESVIVEGTEHHKRVGGRQYQVLSIESCSADGPCGYLGVSTALALDWNLNLASLVFVYDIVRV